MSYWSNKFKEKLKANFIDWLIYPVVELGTMVDLNLPTIEEQDKELEGNKDE